MRARVIVTLRQGILDPAGQAVAASLRHLDFASVRSVRMGKVIDVELDDMPLEQARPMVEAMAKKLLANLVIEDFVVEFL